MNSSHDPEASARGKIIFVFLWIFGFVGSLCVFLLGIFDQFATGRITEIFGVEVSKTFAINIISHDVMELHEYSTSIGRMLHIFIIRLLDVTPNAGRGWPLVILTFVTCIFTGRAFATLGCYVLNFMSKAKTDALTDH
jgi:hypothetical protein